MFRVPSWASIAGCYVTNGTIQPERAGPAGPRRRRSSTRAGSARSAGSRTTSREVAEGFECGIGLESFQDVKEGDVIEAFEVEEFARQTS